MAIKKLIVRGPYKGSSGYDRHVRAFTRELVRQGVEVQLIDLPEWGPVKLTGEHADPFFDELNRPVDAGIALHFTMPHQVEPITGCINVNYTMFEASPAPPVWIEANKGHDLLIVPTESSRSAWIAGGMPADHIEICPLGVDGDQFNPDVEPSIALPSEGSELKDVKTRFLNVSETGPRKNIAGLVRAWMRATQSNDDAILILKVGIQSPGWVELLQRQISEIQNDLGKHLDEAGAILWFHDVLPDYAMPTIFASATHYISLSHGEGWDQPMMEAAATGLRLIAPDHSAYRAYLDNSVAQLIPSTEIPAEFPGDPQLQMLFEGSNWWLPDEEAAISAIRRAIDGKDAPAASARDRVVRRFSWQAATTRLIEILDRYEPSTGVSQVRRWFGRLRNRN